MTGSCKGPKYSPKWLDFFISCPVSSFLLFVFLTNWTLNSTEETDYHHKTASKGIVGIIWRKNNPAPQPVFCESAVCERVCACPCQIGPPPNCVCVCEESNAHSGVARARGGWVQLWRLRHWRPQMQNKSKISCSTNSVTWRKGWCWSLSCTRWGDIAACSALANRPSASPSSPENISSTRVCLQQWGSLPPSIEVRQTGLYIRVTVMVGFVVHPFFWGLQHCWVCTYCL